MVRDSVSTKAPESAGAASETDLAAAFERDGYVVVPGALSRDDAEIYRRRILRLLPDDLTLPPAWESRYGRIKPLHPDGNQTYDGPEFLPLFQNPILYRLATRILRTHRLRVFDGSVGITLRHDRGESPLSQRIHTDNSVPKDADQFRFDLPELEIGGCYYLTDVEPQGGGIALLPGGHRRVEADARASAQGRQLHAGWSDIKGYPDLTEVTGKAGDFVLLHPLMPHAATHNRRSTTRVVQFLRWVRYDHPYGRAAAVPPDTYDQRQLAVLDPLGRKLLGIDPWEQDEGTPEPGTGIQ